MSIPCTFFKILSGLYFLKGCEIKKIIVTQFFVCVNYYYPCFFFKEVIQMSLMYRRKYFYSRFPFQWHVYMPINASL